MKKSAGALAALALLCLPAAAQPTGLPTAESFVDPVSAYSAAIAPDGNHIAYIARGANREQLIVVDVNARTARVLQSMNNDVGAFNWVRWKGSQRLIIGASAHIVIASRAPTGTMIRNQGAEFDIERVVAIDIDGGNFVQMFEGQMRSLSYGLGSTFLLNALPNDPTHVLISAWDNSGTGVWLADVNTGRAERVTIGDESTWYYVTDGEGTPVMRVDWLSDDSGYRIYRRAPSDRDWTFVREARRAGAATNSPDFQILGPGPGAGQVYVLARPDDADLLRLFLYNTATGDLGSAMEQDDRVDIVGAWFSRRTREIIATCEDGVRYQCTALDPSMQRHLTALDGFFQGAGVIYLEDMSADNGRWLLNVDGPTLPGGFYVYDVATRAVEPIVSMYPRVNAVLSPTQVEPYRARDGTNLWAYVTAPENQGRPAPMVVLPHGGPEARDEYGYDSFVQFLASRGYVVVQPNFRGSSGSGRAFADAGRGQWGRLMQDDVTDAVNHMIETGVADPNRICIVGASYGGYVALEGVTATPDLYRCAVSIAGVSDLPDMMREEGVQGRQRRSYHYWLRSVGDPRANREQLEAHSPRRNAAQVRVPVLLIHGDDDDIVPIRQSELMQRALESAGRPTRLVRIPGEGHFWDDWSDAHRLQLYQETEAFLAQNLGPAR